jgi:hypothetical protein
VDVDNEPIVMRESLTLESGAFNRIKGDLTLTPTRLYFTEAPGLLNQSAKTHFDIRLSDVLNARAKRAYRSGIDLLELLVRQDGKERKLLIARSAVAAWASTAAGRGRMGRLEANSLRAWEAAIAEARARG